MVNVRYGNFEIGEVRNADWSKLIVTFHQQGMA